MKRATVLLLSACFCLVARSQATASAHEQVRWHWVKGHIGHALNERADVLAVAATQTAARSRR